jgi:hypothetical protein
VRFSSEYVRSQLTVLAMIFGEVAENGGDEDEEEQRLRDENNND